MSMILGMTSISDRTAAKIFANPSLLWRLLAPSDPEAYLQEAKKRRPGDFLKRLLGRGGTPMATEPPYLELGEAEGIFQDLDKAWHGIHYLLTKTAWEGEPPLNFLLKGGKEVPGIEVGYGKARIFTSQEVRAIYDAIFEIDADFLCGRFDPTEMMAQEIYPQIWDRDPSEDDTLEYCLEYFEVLKQFVSDCVENELGMVITIQ